MSIQFKKGNKKSVVLFSHWGGMEFVGEAEEYLKALKEEVKGKHVMPLERLEPAFVMVDFIREITKNKNRNTNDIYLGVDENDGDNNDNGHHIIDVD